MFVMDILSQRACSCGVLLHVVAEFVCNLHIIYVFGCCLSLRAGDTAASKIFMIPVSRHSCAYDNKFNLTHYGVLVMIVVKIQR